MPAGRPGTQHTLHRQPRLNLAVRADRAYRQPTNMQLAPSVTVFFLLTKTKTVTGSY